MFERYTERARRTLFFARYESSSLGSTVIDTEHLLLGLVREDKGLIGRVFAAAKVSMELLRSDIEDRVTHREKVSTSVEIPFTEPAKRVLQRAAVEADQLDHSHIGCEHLLLAVLHDPTSTAGQILASRGLTYDEVRKEIVRLLNERASLVRPPRDLVAAIEQIKREVSQLASLVDSAADTIEAVDPIVLTDRIHQALDRLKPGPDE